MTIVNDNVLYLKFVKRATLKCSYYKIVTMVGDGYVKFDCDNYFIMCVCVCVYIYIYINQIYHNYIQYIKFLSYVYMCFLFKRYIPLRH